jgi:hypothetical protein
MAKKFETGDKVQWKWGDGYGEAIVREVFTSDVTRTIKGTEVSRNASQESPAYLLQQDDGDEVLKGHSELEAADS